MNIGDTIDNQLIPGIVNLSIVQLFSNILYEFKLKNTCDFIIILEIREKVSRLLLFFSTFIFLSLL